MAIFTYMKTATNFKYDLNKHFQLVYSSCAKLRKNGSRQHMMDTEILFYMFTFMMAIHFLYQHYKPFD